MEKMTDSITNKCREKTFRILCGVRDICDSAGIRMYLLGDAALAAYRGNFDTDDAPVCIDIHDLSKFLDAFNKSGTDLTIDGMQFNTGFPFFELRVYDPKTLDFALSDFRKYRYNCLYVRILFIRNKQSGLQAKVLRSLERAYLKKNLLDYGNRYRCGSRMVKLMKLAEKAKGREYLAQKTFERLNKGYSKASEQLLISGRTYGKEVLADPQTVHIGKEAFLIPGDTENYFISIFGENWQEHEIKEFAESNTMFRDPDISWDDFKDRIAYLDFDRYDKVLKEYRTITKDHKIYDRKVRGYRNLLRRTDLRYRMWQKYMPIKDELIELHRNGDYEQLEIVMHDCLRAMAWCRRHKLGLCFDEDILNIALDMYRHRGVPELADYMNELVPAEHRQPLHIMNNKGEIIL